MDSLSWTVSGLLDFLMTSESPDHLIGWQSVDAQLLECWALCYLIRLASSKHRSLALFLSLSLSFCSTARLTAITVWIKILLNTLLPLQSGQEVWLQLMMALHGRGGRNRRKVYKISEDLEQFHNLKNRPEKLEPNNLLWIANYQPLIII